MILKIAFKHLFSKPFLSIFTLIAVSGSLSILGSFWTIVENLERVRLSASDSGNKEEKSGITLFVDSKVSEVDFANLKKQLHEDKRFSSVEVIPSQEAIKSLEVQFGEALSKAFTLEGMPTTVKLGFSQSALNREDYFSMLNQIRSLPGVLDVDDGFALLPSKTGPTQSPIFSWATALLVFVFSIVALLVSHLIRIAFETLKPEVETLKVLGASRFWIFKPLIVEGLFFGFFGAMGALSILTLAIHFLVPKIEALLLPSGVEIVGLSAQSSLGLLGTSLFASLIGALFTWPLIDKPATEI